jgi:zinc transport system substrate-binding protein
MGPFASRYHLHIESLFSEFKPDDDLTSSEIINFSNLVKASEVKYLFTEALVEPKAAVAIKESLKLNDNYDLILLELHTYHNVNQEDWEAMVTYKDLLERNFENIKAALNATETND